MSKHPQNKISQIPDVKETCTKHCQCAFVEQQTNALTICKKHQMQHTKKNYEISLKKSGILEFDREKKVTITR